MRLDLDELAKAMDKIAFLRKKKPLYKEASYKPYVIAAMIFLAKVKDPAAALEEMEAKARSRKDY